MPPNSPTHTHAKKDQDAFFFSPCRHERAAGRSFSSGVSSGPELAVFKSKRNRGGGGAVSHFGVWGASSLVHFRRCTPKDAPKRCTPRSDRARFQAPKSGSSRGNGKVGRQISGSDLQDFPPLTFPSRRSCKQWGAQRPSFLPPNQPPLLAAWKPWCLVSRSRPGRWTPWGGGIPQPQRGGGGGGF